MTDVGSPSTYKRNKLRGRIIECYKTQKAFAQAVGISQNAFSRKMTGKAGLFQDDIELWCELLGISRDEIGEYFFT